MVPPSVTSIKAPEADGSRSTRRLAYFAVPGIFYLLTACGWTWPLARHLSSHLPLGSETTATVPLFNLWVLRWNAAWWQGMAGSRYWDAPIFHPAQGTLALSEPQPLTGLFFTLIQWASQNPVLSYNLLVLIILALNGWAAAWLMRRLGIPAVPALQAGLLAQGLPFVSRELGVLQLTVLFPLLLALAALWDFQRQPGWRSGLALGGWSGVTFLMSSQYALMFSPFLILGALLLGRQRHLQPRVAAHLLAGVCLAGLILLPVVPHQIRLTTDYQRSESTVRRNSAQMVDYRRLDSAASGAARLPWLLSSGGSGQRLYPGSGLLLLAGVGLASGLATGRHRSWVVFCIAGAMLALGLSLGLNLEIGSWQPYALLRVHYPGLTQLRSPFRFALFGQLMLFNLAGLGLARLWSWRGRPGRTVAFIFVSLSLLELVALPARLYSAQALTTKAGWIRWLGQQPRAVALMLPLPENGRTASFEPVTLGMNQALQHGHILVNGYSGFFPETYRQMTRQLEGFASHRSLAYLQTIGVTYLVIDAGWLTIETNRQLETAPTIDLVYADSTKHVYQLTPNTAAP